VSTIANLSDTAANAEAAAISPLMNSGLIRVYSGTQPATANTALSGNTLLATFTFAATAFTAPVAGLLTANTIASATAVATGTATFARILESDGSTVVMDITVGLGGGAGLNLNATAIMDGVLIPISSFTFAVTET
jgi:hypothetical protein